MPASRPGPSTRGDELHSLRPDSPVRPSPAQVRRAEQAAGTPGARGVLPPPAGAGNVCRSGGVVSGRSRAGPVHSWLHFKSTFRNAPARAGAQQGQPPLPDGRARSAAGAGRSCGPGGGGPRGCRKRPPGPGAPGREPAPRRAGRAGTWPPAPAFSGRPARRVAPRGKRSGRCFSETGREGGGPGSWVRVGPCQLGRIRLLRPSRGCVRGGGRGGERGEGAGARPAEGPPRSRSEPAARPPRGAPLRRGDFPGAPSFFPPRGTATSRRAGLRGALSAAGAPATLRPPQVRKLAALTRAARGAPPEATCRVWLWPLQLRTPHTPPSSPAGSLECPSWARNLFRPKPARPWGMQMP